MSLNIAGKGKVFKVADRGNFVTASLSTSKKVNNEWVSEWFNLKFVGHAGAGAKYLQDKDTIEIIKGILESRKVEDKTYISIVVFEYEKISSGVTKNETKSDADDSGFDLW